MFDEIELSRFIDLLDASRSSVRTTRQANTHTTTVTYTYLDALCLGQELKGRAPGPFGRQAIGGEDQLVGAVCVIWLMCVYV